MTQRPYNRNAAIEASIRAQMANPHGFITRGGRVGCRWCGTAVAGRRQSWCSTDCVRAYEVLALPAVTRKVVVKAAGGRCQLCEWAVVASEKRVRAQVAALSWAKRRLFTTWLEKWLGKGGFSRRFYDIDHTIPLVEGGEHRLANLRLLCRPCHRGETTKLARKRAEEAKNTMSSRMKDAVLAFLAQHPDRTYTARELEAALGIRRPGVVLGQLLRQTPPVVYRQDDSVGAVCWGIVVVKSKAAAT